MMKICYGVKKTWSLKRLVGAFKHAHVNRYTQKALDAAGDLGRSQA